MAEPRADAAFKAEVESRLAASLAERGYKLLAKRDLIFHLDIQSADGICGWLGLPMAIVWRKYVDTTPAVGVHDPKVEHVLADLKAERYDQKAATLTEPLAYLVPDRRGYPMWTFSDLPGLDQALDKLVDAIDTQGVGSWSPSMSDALSRQHSEEICATGWSSASRRRCWCSDTAVEQSGSPATSRCVTGAAPNHLQPSTQRFCGA